MYKTVSSAPHESQKVGVCHLCLCHLCVCVTCMCITCVHVTCVMYRPLKRSAGNTPSTYFAFKLLPLQDMLAQ